MTDFIIYSLILKETVLHGCIVKWALGLSKESMSPREEAPHKHHVFYLVNYTVNKTSSFYFNDWRHCASFLMCRSPARGKTGATWILNASCEVQKPCAQNTESEIFPSSHLQQKIRHVFGNKRIPVPATDMREFGPSGTDLSVNTGWGETEGWCNAMIPDCSKNVSFSSSLNPPSCGGHGRGMHER